MNILFLPKYFPEGASSRYRTHNYISYFIEAGHKVTIKPLFYKGYVNSLYKKKSIHRVKVVINILKRFEYLLLRSNKFDVIVIEKELTPYLPFQCEKLLLQGCKYTLDYDDAVSTRYRENIFKEKLLGDKINSLSKNAVMTTVGNGWYWKEITRGNLEYLPTVIDLERYPISKFKRVKNNVPIISWIGSPSTVKYLNILKKVLIELSKEFEYKLRVIGGNFDIEEIDVELLPWSAEKEFEYLLTSDIGIMPLLETPWEYGKCGFKCIQYMASGLPVVASALPANEEIVIQGETGYIAKNEKDWYEYLKLLLTDSEKRTNFGSKARTRIERNYSYQIWGPKYVKYLESVY